MTLDLVLPDQHGLAFLRADPRTSRLPVVIVSGALDLADLAVSPDLQDAVDWLAKPVDPQALTRAIDRYIHAGELP